MAMTNNPGTTVSVIIPTYNRAYCIGRAIQSILSQTFPAQEIIVVDDGSHDDLETALAPFRKNIHLIRHPRNLGVSSARNTGIRAASSDYIAFLDSDDEWLPEKLAHQVPYMAAMNLTASCTGFTTFQKGETPDQAKAALRPYPARLTLKHLAWGCYTGPGSTLVCHRNLLIEHEGYDTQMACFEDWDLLLRIVERTPDALGYLALPLSRVLLGRNHDAAKILRGLRQIEEKHGALFKARSSSLMRRFRAGLAFNRAAAHRSNGRYVAMAGNLLLTVLLCPFDNWAINVILRDSLRRRSTPKAVTK